jgi:hypothetical protein
MRDFKVIIIAYGYKTSFTVKAEDNAESIENSIVDRLGDSDIKWENSGFYSLSKLWLTYEEIVNGKGPLQSEEGSRDRVGGATA